MGSAEIDSVAGVAISRPNGDRDPVAGVAISRVPCDSVIPSREVVDGWAA